MLRLQKEYETSEQLANLLGFLNSDPTNVNLIEEIATLAISEDLGDLTTEVISYALNLPDQTPQSLNTIGLLAMRNRDFEQAVSAFESISDDALRDPNIAFNMAWSLSMLGQHVNALDKLTSSDAANALGSAAMLEVQLYHQLGNFEVAESRARELIEIHPDDEGLMAAVSVLAMDIEDVELARSCAQKSGNHPDALTTIGVLELGEDNYSQATDLFQKAIDINPHRPRSWIGMGLAQLATGEAGDARTNLDKGAEMFGTHLGSWIAAGWSHFIANDIETSRERFEHALSLDDTFAESHGSLAVLDVLSGDIENAKIRTKTALRLDRECFSAALAQVLLLSSDGNADAAQKIFDRAINTPVSEGGKTLSESLIKMGLDL